MGNTGETLGFLSMVDNSWSILEDQILGEPEEDVEKGYWNVFLGTLSIASGDQRQHRRKHKSLLSILNES